jgi:hypothetical protein
MSDAVREVIKPLFPDESTLRRVKNSSAKYATDSSNDHSEKRKPSGPSCQHRMGP